MRSVPKIVFTACAAVLLVCAGGCLPSNSSPLDEQREPHFLTGKSRVNSMDYDGAIEAFEKALEVNPRSASAHLELGLLYENNQQDFAAAIYHFDRYLKLRPNSENAEIIRQREIACKQELAKTVSLAPVAQSLQHDLERLSDENRQLKQQVESWKAFYDANAAHLAAVTNPPPTQPQPQPAKQTAATPARPTTPAQNNFAQAPAPAHPAKPSATIGTYAIKSGDTPASVARKYGVKLDALLAANPGLDAKHLKIGQTVTIPAP